MEEARLPSLIIHLKYSDAEEILSQIETSRTPTEGSPTPKNNVARIIEKEGLGHCFRVYLNYGDEYIPASDELRLVTSDPDRAKRLLSNHVSVERVTEGNKTTILIDEKSGYAIKPPKRRSSNRKPPYQPSA